MQGAVPVGAGAMAALLGLDFEQVEEVARDAAEGDVCDPANDNAPGQVVVSGDRAAVERAVALAKARGARRAILLDVSAPFHCSLLQPAADAMAEALEAVDMEDPSAPLVANVTARPAERAADLPNGVRVSTEYPNLTSRFFAEQGIEADVQLSYGATEAKVPEIVDCVVELTETGGALRAAGLRIIDTVLVSHTELLANPAAHADPAKRHAMSQIATLLSGVLEARGRVLVKMNVPEGALGAVIDLLPSMKAPTVNELYSGQGFAVETVVPKTVINTLIPELSEAGATDILELPLAKIVH